MKYRIITKAEAGFCVDEFAAETVEIFIEQIAGAGYEVSGVNNNPAQREELQGVPNFKGVCGPMWDGDAIRYECSATYAEFSA